MTLVCFEAIRPLRRRTRLGSDSVATSSPGADLVLRRLAAVVVASKTGFGDLIVSNRVAAALRS